jgi:hypothetical protein
MGPDFTRGGAPGYLIENKPTLLMGRRVLMPEPGQQGFPNYPEPPRVLFDKKLGRPPRDLEECSGYWLISDRLKTVLETVDPAGVAFVRCEVRLRGGEPGPTYWLCDVVRVLDAVDEMASRLRIYDEQGRKKYSLVGGASLVFKEDVVGSAHVFRITHAKSLVICDQHLKDSCKAAGLKGIKFRDAAHY